MYEPKPSAAPHSVTADARGGEIVGAAGAVVVGIDGSAADGPVVDWGADEAHRQRSPLRLVSVIDPGVQMTSYEVLASGSLSLAERLADEAHRLIEAASTRALARHSGLDVAASAPWGPPAAALVRLSDGAHRMVVGGPPRGRLEGILLGSIALPVVAHSRCPVVVVPTGTKVVTPRRIVVGVDGSDASARAVELALQTAEACGAAVTCVLAWNLEVEDGVVVTEPSSTRWSAVEQRYSELGHRTVAPLVAHHPGVDVDIVVRQGPPAKALVEAASDLEADLLALGSRGRGGFTGLLLGSVSRRVLEQADRVVAIVR
jgi:nucleotide-binding universal stress UspA family protein